MGLRLQPNSEELKKVVQSAQNDNKNVSAKEAIKAMGNSSIFSGEGVTDHFDRMANAVDSLINNHSWKVAMDTDGDGEMENLDLADAIASSFDSELDLYIQEKVNEALKKFGSCSKGYLGEQAQQWLYDNYGITVEAIGGYKVDKNGEIMKDENGDPVIQQTNRTYAFSLVDKETGEVMQDANGKKGSYIFSDCLIPDGYAQGAEVNLSSILDQMGYDCISKADFIGREEEYEQLISAVEENVNAGLYSGSGDDTSALYGVQKDITTAIKNLWGGSGSAPGQNGGVSSSEQAEIERQEQEDLKAQKEEYKQELIDEATKKYEDENGEKPTGQALIKIENEAELKAGAKFNIH